MVQPWDYLHKPGRSGLTVGENYIEKTSTLSGQSVGNNILRVQPLWVGDEPLRVLKLGFRANNTQATLGVKLGIYAVTSESNIYPADLVYDFGTAAWVTGPNWTPDGDVTLQPGMYWAASLHNDAGPIGQWVSSGEWVTANVLGMSQGNNQYVTYGLQVARTYALGFPVTFPAGATGDIAANNRNPGILIEPFG